MASRPVRVAVVGTGKRFSRYYEDVLASLVESGAAEVACVYNRTAEKADGAVRRFGCRRLATIAEVLRDSRVDAVLNLVAGPAKDAISEETISARKHLFLETPAASSSVRAAALAQAAAHHGSRVQVAEDFAFFPEARLQRDVVRSGALGPVEAVVNDEAGFGYHGFARLHALVDALPAPASFWGANAAARELRLALFGISFADRLQYIQRFPDPKNHISRWSSGWKIVCRNGVIGQHEIALAGAAGAARRIPFETQGRSDDDGPDGIVEALTVELSGQRFSWRAAHGTERWSRKKQAVLFLVHDFLLAVAEGRPVAYDIERTACDIALWRISMLFARMPFPLRLPARPLLALERLLAR